MKGNGQGFSTDTGQIWRMNLEMGEDLAGISCQLSRVKMCHSPQKPSLLNGYQPLVSHGHLSEWNKNKLLYTAPKVRGWTLGHWAQTKWHLIFNMKIQKESQDQMPNKCQILFFNKNGPLYFLSTGNLQWISLIEMFIFQGKVYETTTEHFSNITM